MRHILIGCSSQYVHTNLAVYYLSAACHKEGIPLTLLHTTVNRDSADTLRELLTLSPDTAAFSCYLWNIEFVLRLAADLKAVRPGLRVILGGPEVSFNASRLLEKHDQIDYVLCGEGEESYPALLRALERGGALPEGAVSRERGAVPCEYPVIRALDTLPSPYTKEMLADLSGRIVYYESSRGCPYHCSYCLSSVCGGVRQFSLARVESDLRKLTEAGIPLIKFVDRTFNWDVERTLEILALLSTLSLKTRWHFEIGGDLLDDRVLKSLLAFPAGTIQLEMGVQSTNPDTLKEIGRREDVGRMLRYARRIIESGRIHLHMDLIAGLPFEGAACFENSFNTVYAARPHTLQLGFLKLLSGSPLRRDAETYGILYRDYPPYEVLATAWMSAEELLALKETEEAVDRFYNSGRFPRSLFYLEEFYSAPFAMYRALGRALREKSGNRPRSARSLYEIVYHSGRQSGADGERLLDLLRVDQYAAGVAGPLSGLPPEDTAKTQAYVRSLLENEARLLARLPQLEGLSLWERNARLRFLLLCRNPETGEREEGLVLFDRERRDPVTGRLMPFFEGERGIL